MQWKCRNIWIAYSQKRNNTSDTSQIFKFGCEVIFIQRGEGQFIKTRHKREMARAKFSGQRMFAQKKTFLRKCIFHHLSLFHFRFFKPMYFPQSFTRQNSLSLTTCRMFYWKTILWSVCNYFFTIHLFEYNFFFCRNTDS